MLITSNPRNPGLASRSPLDGPKQVPSKPELPQDGLVPGGDSGSPKMAPRWALAAFAGMGLLAGGGIAHAQVQVVEQPKDVAATMKRLEDSSLAQGIDLQFMIPSPIGGGRPISHEDASQMLAEGKRVLLAEVTSSSGPTRGEEPTEIRREAYLTGAGDLESYARYFTNETPRNPVEKAAQQLKSYLYQEQDLTLLQRPNSHPDRPSMSPFEAARRLDQGQTVKVSRSGDGEIRPQSKVVELNSLEEVDALVNPEGCVPFVDYQVQPDGTIQLVTIPSC